MATERWDTKRVSTNIDVLLAQCEVTFDTATMLGGQQAEAWARKALREARNARGSFDDGAFQYVPGAFRAAAEFHTIARQLI